MENLEIERNMQTFELEHVSNGVVENDVIVEDIETPVVEQLSEDELHMYDINHAYTSGIDSYEEEVGGIGYDNI